MSGWYSELSFKTGTEGLGYPYFKELKSLRTCAI